MPRSPRPGSEQLEAWQALLSASRNLRLRLGREVLEECGLSLAWYEVLLRLWEVPGHRLRMYDLALETQLSRNGLSQLVGRMESAGLVGRTASAGDARGTLAVLTPAGRRAFHRAARVHLRGLEEHFGSRLTPDEARQLVALLRLVSGRSAAAPEPPTCIEADEPTGYTGTARPEAGAGDAVPCTEARPVAGDPSEAAPVDAVGEPPVLRYGHVLPRPQGPRPSRA